MAATNSVGLGRRATDLHFYMHGNTFGPRVEIKFSDSVGNQSWTIGMEGKNATEPANHILLLHLSLQPTDQTL